jgi:enoyl-CoA hydratase
VTSASGPVVVETADAVATVTLNRPDRLNAVSLPLYDELTDALDAIETDATARAVILTGAGRAFCAGADLKEHGAGDTAGSRGAYVEVGQRVHRRLQVLSKPIVAAVNGAAVGAGLELALACDLVVVAEDAKLRFPELAFGTFVGGGTTYTLVQRIGLTRAKELIMLAEFFSGREAAEMGLANRAVPADRVLEVARSLAKELATRAPLSLALAKRLLDKARHVDSETALSLEADALLDCLASVDWEEGQRAFSEKRPPRFTGD